MQGNKNSGHNCTKEKQSKEEKEISVVSPSQKHFQGRFSNSKTKTMFSSSDQNGAPNFDDMSDDAAATEFENTFMNLISHSAGTPEDVNAAVEDLLETLETCITKSATLHDMVAYIFDSASTSPMIHYTASTFLARLTEKFTQEVEGMTLAKCVIQKLRNVAERCTLTLNQLTTGNADPQAVAETRNLCMFFADLAPKVVFLGSFRTAVPAVILTVFELLEKLVVRSATVPKADFLDNCFCAVQMLKLTGPTIDELIRNDPTISQKIPGVVPKLYQTIRNILIDSNDLNSRIRAGIIKVLEFRASRWGDVPSPDQPLETKEAGPGGVDEVDEVDPVWYGPDNIPLSKEEADFLNNAANEGNQAESDSEDDVEQVYEPQEQNGQKEQNEQREHNEHNEHNGRNEQQQEREREERLVVDENQAPPPVWRYGYDAVPSAAMEEFRRRLKPDYKPDGAGDRLRNK